MQPEKSTNGQCYHERLPPTSEVLERQFPSGEVDRGAFPFHPTAEPTFPGREPESRIISSSVKKTRRERSLEK